MRDGNSNGERAKVTFSEYGVIVEVPKGTTLLDAARLAGIGIRSLCGGRGLCGKCKVLVRGSVKHELRKEPLLSRDEVERGYVLACLTRVLGDVEVAIPPESSVGRAKLLSAVLLPSSLTVEPLIVTQPIDEGSAALKGLRHSAGATKRLEGITKGEATEAVIDLYRGKLIDVRDGKRGEGLYGIAVDVGTTKIVVALVDLSSGKMLGVDAEFNRQLIYGEDVISRISKAVGSTEGLRELQRAAIDTINEVVTRLCKALKVDPKNIYAVSAAGNTAMTYLLLGENPYPLIKSFKEHVRIEPKPHVLDASDLGLNVNPSATVYVLPCVGRFLGGDVVGDVITAGLNFSNEVSLLIDIGTNAEVVLGCRDWFIGTTAPAGPAFEGWGLRFGVRAVAGAVESVTVDPKTLSARYVTIDNAKPIGICGSGYIDLVAQLFTNGVIDHFGKFYRNLPTPYVREGPDGYEYLVVPAQETAIGKDITVSEKDIYNVIDSKSSVCAAVSVLLKKMRLSVHEVKRVYVCGAFGKYLNINSAIAIGMLPEFPNAVITYIGNGSLGGAYLTLISKTYRGEAERVAKLMASLELMLDPDFMDEYEAGFKLPGRRDLFPSWWERSRAIRPWKPS